MTKTLEQLLAEVTDEASFLRFVSALGKDFEADREQAARLPPSPYAPGPLGWENITIGLFLESATAWASDMEDRLPHTNPWHRCASILLAGKFYE